MGGRCLLSPKKRLILSIAVLISVFVLGTAGYALLERCSLFDAAYMTTITLSTVGFEEHIRLDKVGRAWTILVITLGIGGVSFAFTSVITLFISGDVNEMLGRRKLQSTVDQLRGHVILCGFGRMGMLTLEKLRKVKARVVVVERSPEPCEWLKEQNMLYIHGDATEEGVLLQAGLMHCGALVSVLPSDADNVYATLTANGLRPDLTIIARAEHPSTEAKLKHAGAARVICPHIVGAHRIADILTKPNVVDFFEVAAAGIELEMDEFVVRRDSPLCDVTLLDSPIRKTAGATVIAIRTKDGETVYQPAPDHRIRQGDTLIMIGKTGVSTRLRDLAD